MARTRASFRFKLEGVGTLEETPLGDVAEFLRSLVVLVARGAAEELAQPSAPTGRWKCPIEQAAELRLVRLRSGSLVADVVEAPARPVADGLPIEVETLSLRGLDRIVDATAGGAARHPLLAGALADFLDRYASTPEAKLRVQDLREGTQRKGVVAVADRQQLRRLGQTSAVGSADRDVAGRLFEANLETGRAQIRTAAGKVDVSFDKDLEPEIKRLLGDRAGLRGEAVFDSRTNQLKAPRVRQVLAGDQLAMADYWDPKSLDALSMERGGHPIVNSDDLAVPGVTDSEWESFFEAIGVAR